MSKILIIEDEESIRRVLNKVLIQDDKSYSITEAVDGLDGISKINSSKFDLILCDIKMPKKDGIEVLKHILTECPNTPTIMISGHGDLETAVESMRLGAFDYISKPPDLNRLLNSVRSALLNKNFVKKGKSKSKSSGDFNIIGKSEAITNIQKMIDKVSLTNAKVLIQGPNGSGKELVAHQIHMNSLRNSAPFIEVNCAAIPSELIESELFGHLKGSFTSAVKDRQGKFEAANNGTLFLDEIGDMSLAAQAKVLRALEESKIQRVGSQKDISVDVRVVAATNKDLKKEIENGNFREDLYHRLAVIMIEVPQLSKRKSDIPILVSHFSKLLSKEQGIETKDFNKDSIKLLEDYNWSGNIRELRNVIERLIILGGDPVSKEDVKLFASKNNS